MAHPNGLYEAILNGDAKKAHATTEAALAAGVAPMDLIQESMVPAMDEVGRLFEAEEYFVPELLFAGRAMKCAMELLKPLLSASELKMAVQRTAWAVRVACRSQGRFARCSGGLFETIPAPSRTT
jgi:methanogenic corrinoid protein MtbC1